VWTGHGCAAEDPEHPVNDALGGIEKSAG
jgi:hypothetical protein